MVSIMDKASDDLVYASDILKKDKEVLDACFNEPDKISFDFFVAVSPNVVPRLFILLYRKMIIFGWDRSKRINYSFY